MGLRRLRSDRTDYIQLSITADRCLSSLLLSLTPISAFHTAARRRIVYGFNKKFDPLLIAKSWVDSHSQGFMARLTLLSEIHGLYASTVICQDDLLFFSTPRLQTPGPPPKIHITPKSRRMKVKTVNKINKS